MTAESISKPCIRPNALVADVETEQRPARHIRNSLPTILLYSIPIGQIVGLVGQDGLHASLHLRQVVSSLLSYTMPGVSLVCCTCLDSLKRNHLGIIAVVDDLRRGSTICVGKRSYIQVATVGAADDGADPGCALTNEARAEMCVSQEAFRDADFGCVVYEE